MRKFLSFLALFVMAFALPHQAKAWDFSGNSSPKSLEVKFTNNFTNNSGKTLAMTYNSTTKMWTCDFTPEGNNGYADFILNATNNNNTVQVVRPNVSGLGGSYKAGWYNCQTLQTDQNNTNHFYLGDLDTTGATTYTLQITKYDSGDNGNNLRFRVIAKVAEKPLDFSTDTNPTSVKLKFTNGNDSYALTFENGVWSNNAVTLKNVYDGGYVNFFVEVTKSDGTTEEYGYDFGASSFDDNVNPDAVAWVENVECKTGDDFYQGGLSANTAYRVEITGSGENKFKFRFTNPIPDVVWDLDGNTTPKKVVLHGKTGTVGDWDMEFGANGFAKWSCKMIAQRSWINFTLDLYRNDTNFTTYGKNGVVSSTVGSWSAEQTLDNTAKNGQYQLTNLTIGKKYLIEIQGAGDNKFQVRAVELEGENNVYLYVANSAPTSNVDVTMMGNATVGTDGKCSFTVDMTAGQYFILSRNGNATKLQGTQSHSGRYNPTSMTNAPCTDISFTNANNGAWKVVKDGTYTIDVNWTEKKLTATVKEAAPTTLYIYDYGTTPSQIAQANGDADGIFTFNVDLGSNQAIGLSLRGGVTDWNSFDSGDYKDRFNPSADVYIPAEGIKFAYSTNGSWKARYEGPYTITVDWNNKSLTAVFNGTIPETEAPKYLYLYQGNTFKQLASSSPNSNYIYTYNVVIPAGEKIVLSTVAGATNWGGINAPGNRFNPVNNAEIEIPGDNLPFDANPQTDGNKDGIWKTTKEGKYTITVDWVAKTLTAKWSELQPLDMKMPLTSADFRNSNPHYFLVGERQGNWRLQPEWEFKVEGDELVLRNRFIYTGDFAIGMVDKFDNYKVHNYTVFCKDFKFEAEKLEYNEDISGTGVDYKLNVAAKTNPTKPANHFQNIIDGGDYYYGRGVFMKEIRVTLKDGKPSTIKFVKGSDEESASNRLFTLVGSHIYNTEYCNSSSKTHTPMFNLEWSDDNGWQEGWIQFDPADNKPYVDGNGEYMYHTAFCPDWLTVHPTPFKQPLKSGDDFDFTSNGVQFVEHSKLPNLESDPYKDFYKLYNGKATIETLQEHVFGTGYDFIPVVDGGAFTATKDWSCYVVRDMWIAGEIKFWSGWGGNATSTFGAENKADWFGPNGGPQGSAPKPVVGFDVTEGDAATLYHNARQNPQNYKVSDGEPVYFNRVVLWFNDKDGVNESFIQFIQESFGPAILAKVVTNTAFPERKNYIEYNWYLNPVASGHESDKNLKVVGYEIRRFRVESNVQTFIGYPEGSGNSGYVDISDKNVTVGDLYKASAGNYDFTSHLDPGIRGDEGFASGLYQYDIFVSYIDSDGSVKKKQAVSNRVPIYGDDFVVPDAVAMQLVQLRYGYTDHYETSHPSGITTLETALGFEKGTFESRFAGGQTSPAEGLDENGGAATGDKVNIYLTYRPNDNANFYVCAMTENSVVIGDATYTSTVPYKPMIVDSKMALKFMNENPDKFWWTSDYYLRCLDWNQYERTMQGYIYNGMIEAGPNAGVPLPSLSVTEDITADDGTHLTTLTHGRAVRFDFDDDQSYYATIVKRSGMLSDANFKVLLEYTYKPKDEESKTESASAATEIDPVVPRPFMPLYRYKYHRLDKNPAEDYDWGKIYVPLEDISGMTQEEALAAGKLKEAYVKFDDDFTPRTFDLQVDFYRPNVNKDIYTYYDIQYDVTLVNQDKTVPLNMEAVLHDLDYEDKAYPNRYRMEFRGMHPRNGIYPTVSFVKTEYVPRKFGSDAPVNANAYKSQTGNFGEKLVIDCERSIGIDDSGILENVHLGKIKRAGDTYDWMYKGHEHFEDPNDIIETTGNKYEDIVNSDSDELIPRYYLIEAKNGSDHAIYNYLVPHRSNHQDGMKKDATGKVVIELDPKYGHILNDTDPLIGTYIAKGFKSETTPTIYATAVYMFQRNIAGVDRDEVITNYNRLEVVSQEFHKASSRNSAPARIKEDFKPGDWETEGVGDLPAIDTVPQENVLDMSAPDEKTGYNAFVAVRGATYHTTPGDDTVTGVEDVLFGAEDGETVYYNLQGIRIDEPTTAGVYFRVRGREITKFVVK